MTCELQLPNRSAGHEGQSSPRGGTCDLCLAFGMGAFWLSCWPFCS